MISVCKTDYKDQLIYSFFACENLMNESQQLQYICHDQYFDSVKLVWSILWKCEAIFGV